MQPPISIHSSYIASTEAAERYGLTNDHIASLCRRKKVEGALAGGRLWFVDEGSLKTYLAKTQEEREARNRQLSERIRQEQAEAMKHSSWHGGSTSISLAVALVAFSSFIISGPIAAKALAEVPWAEMPAAVAQVSGEWYDQTFMAAAVAYLDMVDGVGDVQARAYLSLYDGVASAAEDTLGPNPAATVLALPDEIAELSVRGWADMSTWYAQGFLAAVAAAGDASEYFYEASAQTSLAIAYALPVAAEKTLAATAYAALGFAEGGINAAEYMYSAPAKTALAVAEGLGRSGEALLTSTARNFLSASEASGAASERLYASVAQAFLATGEGIAQSGESLMTHGANSFVDGVYAVGDGQEYTYLSILDTMNESAGTLGASVADAVRAIDGSAAAVAGWYKQGSERVSRKVDSPQPTQTAAVYDSLTNWLAAAFFTPPVVAPDAPARAVETKAARAVEAEPAASSAAAPSTPAAAAPVQVIVHEVPGVSRAELDTAVTVLSNELRSLVYEMADKGIAVPQYIAAGGSGVNPSAPAGRIDKLDNVTITNATVSGYMREGTVAIGSGGTGTTSAPSYGQVLLGNGNGGYNLVATSSLGITGGGGGGASSIDGLSDGKSDGGSTFLGAYAGENDDGSNANTGVGNGALYTNTSGQNNAALGVSSLYSNVSGDYNIAVGLQALFNNVSGDNNVGIGYYALGANQDGGDNTAVGTLALAANESGGSNTALGNLALQQQNGGSYNVAVGTYAGSGVSGANSSRNTFIGYGAGLSNSTGSGNTFLGFYAGSGMGSGHYNILIGNGVDAPDLSGSAQLNIGNLLYGTGVYGDTYSTSSAPTAGKFAVGTTTPYARATIWGLGTGTNALLELVSSASTTLARVLDNGTAYFSGNVGVGTTTPSWKLQVAASRPFFTLSDTAAGSNLKHWSLSSQGGNLYLATSSDAYATSSIPAFMIASTTRIGVGTTSPYAKLSVAGVVAGASINADNASATSSFAGGLNVGSGALAYDYSGGLTTIQNLAVGSFSFDTDSGIVSWFDMPVTSNASAGTVESYTAYVDGYNVLTVYGESDGSGGATNFRVGIGTSSPLYVLDVASTTGAGSVARFTNGTGNCTINPTTTSLSCSSDARLKKDVEAIGKAQALAGILALRPVKYNWLTEEASTSLHSGFIAQEVNEIFPDLVAQGDNGYYTLNYGGFAPYLVSAIQQVASVVTGFAEEFTTKKLCVEDVCVTREQFLKMVQAAGETPSAPELPPETGE